MREYKPKDDVQKKSYYSDRFYVTPQTSKKDFTEDEIYTKDVEFLSSSLNIEKSYIERDELVIYINSDENVRALELLKNDLEYDMLMELSAIDYISSRDGFEIFYELLSMTKHKRIRVKCFIQKDEVLKSVYSLFKMANWSEREMYDMYGVKISNHPNMKRILMPDDWYDYPLRKTYPLQGDEAASWYEVDKIFGKEAREVIGPEERDPAAIDRYDTTRFSRLGYEVPFGQKPDFDKEPNLAPQYTEKGGVKLFGVRLVKDFEKEPEIVERRK